MFNIYKYNYINNKSFFALKNLNILRLDISEEDIYKIKFIDNQYTSKSLRSYGSKLQKIGFISDDFKESRPSGQLSITFFKNLQYYKDHFEIYFYTRKNVSNRFKKFATIRQCIQNRFNKKKINIKLKQMIINDKIDILFDMQGHMHNNYNDILNEKLAPIMCHWLGYPGTIGIPTFDYIFADPIIIPPNSQKYYREKIAYFPQCYQPNNEELIISKKILYSDYSIPENKFIFCHFNSDYKIDRKMWFVMLSILKKVPDSILFFKTTTQSFKKKLLEDAYNYGINNEQLLIVKRSFITNHIKRLSLCNLGLDNFRLNGHTTSSDLIAAGIPFITYSGNTYHNRVAKSILSSLSLDELCVDSFDKYIDLAVKLATDKKYYESICNTLIQNRELVLFNSQKYTKNFVSIINNIWKLNYQDDLEYIWIFYPNKTFKDNNILVTNERGKKLVDLANKMPNCIAYTTDGYLKNKVADKNSWIDITNKLNEGETSGLWIKEKLEEYPITKFGNNNKNKKFKWIFYKDVDSPGFNINVVNEKNQVLRDIAEKEEKCIGFNLNGHLKSKIINKNDWIPSEGNGLWIKESIEIIKNDYNIDNKCYDLPLIIVYLKINSYNDYTNISEFYEKDLYLNKAILFLIHKNCQDLKRIEKKLFNKYNFVLHTVNDNTKLDIKKIINIYFSKANYYIQYNNQNINKLFNDNVEKFTKL